MASKNMSIEDTLFSLHEQFDKYIVFDNIMPYIWADDKRAHKEKCQGVFEILREWKQFICNNECLHPGKIASWNIKHNFPKTILKCL